jgi:hypothetical protein
MQEVITHPGGVVAGERGAAARRHLDLGPETIARVCTPSRHLSSRQRLGIYANMYFWRLADILSEEYPTVHALVGPERFYRLAVDFLVAHPSRSYTLNVLSVPFPAFLAASRLPRRGLLADVARVERAIEEVFDAPAGARLTAREARRIPMSRWASGRLTLSPAMQLLELAHPVNGLIAAVRAGKSPRLPAKKEERLVVYRLNGRVWRAPLSRESFTLLTELKKGRTLPEAFAECTKLRGCFDEGVFVRSLGGWFKAWASDGLICGVE